MKRIFFYLGGFAFFMTHLFFFGCMETSKVPATADKEIGSWTIYTPYDWDHDGHPFFSTYCTVYSDAAGDEMKRSMGKIADEHFEFILDLFSLNGPADFIYPPGYSKLEIYINIDHPENINWAYWGGFIITIRSDEISGPWLEYTRYTVTHELTHQIEFLIEGQEVLRSDFWFKEGIAVYTACLKSSLFSIIKNRSELESWVEKNQDVPGQGNPIKIKQYSDLPEGADIDQYYRVFELAVRYLMDARGGSASYFDVLNLFYDLRNGVSFEDSFVNHFSIRLIVYENEFFNRMREYLTFNNH